MHAGGGTNDRGEKRNVLIVSVLLLIGSNLTLRSNTQRRIQILRVRQAPVLLHVEVLKAELVVEGIWGAFAESNFWFRNLNRTPLVFLKPSSQVNNFTEFFHFFMGMSKSVFSICLG